MSEVYIRSQNKEKIYVLGNGFNCLRYKKRGNRHTICIGDGVGDTEIAKDICITSCREGEIAEYESKERCIEVLDEIENTCGRYLYDPGSAGLIIGSGSTPSTAAIVPRLYQMPNE